MRTVFLSFFTAALLLAGRPLDAKAAPMAHPIQAEVRRVVDGDTVEVYVRVWPRTWVVVYVRLLGVDTPEIHGKCKSETDRANAAKLAVMSMVPTGSKIDLVGADEDKYAGRVLARVRLPDGRDLSSELVSRGLARPYDGGTRSSWCGGEDAQPRQ